MDVLKLIIAAVVLGGFCILAAIFCKKDDLQIEKECVEYREYINNLFKA